MSDNTTPTSTDLQPTTTGGTATADRLWAALQAHPGSTTEQLAAHASLGQSTAGKILARWVSEATISRNMPNGTGKGRRPATFTIAASADVIPGASDTHPERDKPASDDVATDPTPSDPTPGDDTSAEKVARLTPGGLRGMVEDYLRDHPTDDLGPAKIGTELGRSSGAVANALDRLVKDGYAQMTSPKPKRYRLAPAAPSGD